jgi:hypothetical protein
MNPNNGEDTARILASALATERPEVTRAVCRGACRLLYANGFACVTELPLPDGRRADIVGMSDAGTIWIVEVKSSMEDFRVDQKWPDYKAFCDEFFFAVSPDFPRLILPEDEGLILADRFGGEIARHGTPRPRLTGSRRTALTRRLARFAALKLQTVSDPDFARELAVVTD